MRGVHILAGTSTVPSARRPHAHSTRPPARPAPVTLAALLGAPGAAAAPGSAGLPAAARSGVAGAVDPGSVALTFRLEHGGFVQPTVVTSAKDASMRIFVATRSGRVRIYKNGQVNKTAYLDIRGRVNSSGGEQGLLGLTFDPDFRNHPRLWVAYTTDTGALRVSRFRADSSTSGSVRPSTERVVLTVPHPTYANHNGGDLSFGKDGSLYISTGDGGGGGDPFGNAQDLTSLSGKILKISARSSCGGRNYCVPKSNPYYGSTPGRGEIWLSGLRNPYRFSLDASTGDLWIGDVGQNLYEEVDHVLLGHGGRNLGWSCYEGTVVYDSSRCRSGVTYKQPSVTYDHSLGASVIGGYVYRGARYPALLGGTYLYGDFISGRVWAFRDGARAQVGSLPHVDDFGQGQSNDLWAVTLDGSLYSVRAHQR